ncbi:MAG: type IV pilin N-terminal domain-containing protein [Halanaeroarchaeum sp.]
MESERGATETVGTILMLAVVVTTITLAGAAIFSANAPNTHPVAEFAGSVNGSTMSLEHVGGEPIQDENFVVILRESGTSIDGTEGSPLSGADSDGLFEPGERWVFSVDHKATPGEPVAIVHTARDRVLLDELTLESGTVTASAPTPTVSTSTPTTATTTTKSTTGADTGDSEGFWSWFCRVFWWVCRLFL